MTKKYALLLTFVLSILSLNLFAQEGNPWSRIEASSIRDSQIQRNIRLERFRGFALDRTMIERALENVPSRRQSRPAAGVLMKFPDREGRMIPFLVKEAPVMSPELSEKYPNNRSYAGMAADGSQKRIRFSLNEVGLYGVIMGPGQEVQYIEPLTRDKRNYRVYDRSQLQLPEAFSCLVDKADMDKGKETAFKAANDLQLRTFRLAVAATGEYSQFHINLEGAGSGTDAQKRAVVLAAITTAITRVNAVLENDLAVSMELIANNDDIIYLNANTDPYTNNDGSAMLGQNQSNLDAVIGTANYDIGHVFSTGGGGVATLGSACITTAKARGVTGLGSPVGDTFYFDYVAHELGHQLGANHTFNGDDGNCDAVSRNDATAMEPGSGTTIMAYPGICASDNVQGQVDLYFHAISIQEIMNNLKQGAGTCAELSPLTVNRNVPQANAGPDFTIPVGTPFVLRGSGSDADNDPLTYCWEQMDNGFFVSPPVGTSVGGALYRSLPPVEVGNRYLPELSTLAQGQVSSTWEVTPLVSRQLNFRLTVRDNNAEAGQVDTDDVAVTVTSGAGPFRVTSQATEGVVWTPGSQETITWNVAGTTGNGVNVSRVNIRLSTDGGKTFPTLLASNVNNDGTQAVTVPNSQAPNCRVMVEAVGNFFFALNSAAFSIGEFNEVCVENAAQDTPILIPDDDPAGIVSEIEITDEMMVEKVAVKLTDLQHTYLGDLDILIESPSGTVVELISAACAGSENIQNAIFEDTGAEIDCFFPPAAGITGSVRPFEALSAFAGESALGIWKLRVIDRAEADEGTLVSWSLEMCTSEPVLGVNNVVFVEFKVYPNPSDGRFRVQFTSDDDGDVLITIFDLVGRKVAERRYSGSSNSFDEEMQVEGLSSGLYILRVRRGNKISSQKITLE